MFVVLVEFEVRPERVSDFRRRVCQQASDSLEKEAGCRLFDVCIDPENAACVVLYEIYDDRAAFDLHLDSEHFKAFDGEVGDWVASKQVRTLQLL